MAFQSNVSSNRELSVLSTTIELDSTSNALVKFLLPVEKLENARQRQIPGIMHASLGARNLLAALERMRRSIIVSTAKVRPIQLLYQQVSAITCSIPTVLNWKPRKNIRLKSSAIIS